jgi:ribosome-binding protein aMBF1 (putative translation factor)
LATPQLGVTKNFLVILNVVLASCPPDDCRPWVDVMQSFMITPMRRQKVAIAFGRVLREARKQKGLSQEDLAGDAGFDRTYPSLLERGLRTPTLTVLFQLARVLEVSAAFLVNKTLEELNRG